MKIALVALVCVAVVLGIFAYFAVFSGTQVIEPVTNGTNTNASSTGTSTVAFIIPTSSASATNNQVPAFPSTSTFATTFAAPYPITWSQGGSQLAITGASLQGTQLTLTVNIQLGANGGCVPINLRMVIDEVGDMEAPSSPITENYPLAPDGSCNVAPNATYVSNLNFAVDPTAAPFLFTTGGSSGTFFEVSTTTTGVQVAIPQQSG